MRVGKDSGANAGCVAVQLLLELQRHVERALVEHGKLGLVEVQACQGKTPLVTARQRRAPVYLSVEAIVEAVHYILYSRVGESAYREAARDGMLTCTVTNFDRVEHALVESAKKSEVISKVSFVVLLCSISR